MNCKEASTLLLDYQDNTLDKAVHASVQEHVDNCDDCSAALREYQMLASAINNYKEELPDSQLELAFYKTLEQEKSISSSSDIIVLSKRQLKTVLQVAASLLLMALSYHFGAYQQVESNLSEITGLEKEKAELKELLTFALIENTSASKRLQAVSYAMEIQHPDNDLIEVLIRKMNHDRHINVRLASANALMTFSTNGLVRDALIDQLEREEHSTMQIELIRILAAMQERRAIPTIRRLLDSRKVPDYIKDQINTELQQII